MSWGSVTQGNGQGCRVSQLDSRGLPLSDRSLSSTLGVLLGVVGTGTLKPKPDLLQTFLLPALRVSGEETNLRELLISSDKLIKKP